MPRDRVIVLKFGGSVLRDESCLARAVAEIDRWRRAGDRVVAVVSAFRGRTDALLDAARRHSDSPDPGALAALVATGEHESGAALALALDSAGLGARLLDAAGAGLRTVGDPTDATLVACSVGAFRAAFARDEVVVVPGFIGRSASGGGGGGATLLGRGGSDYTALYLASCLGARCRLVKDVPGVFDRDPHAPGARRFATVSWGDALALGSRIVQPKALALAAQTETSFEVGALDAQGATLVGAATTTFARDSSAPQPLRVALLGAGTVGLGVLQRLLPRSEAFEIVGVGCRNASRAVARGVPAPLVRTDPAALLDEPCDVVVEALGGVEPATTLIERSLRRGVSVVSVNKSAVARSSGRLDAARLVGGGALLVSGAVGGAAPILATASRLRDEGGVERLDAVLNGTTNFVLDRIAEGQPLDDAVRVAQARGFAEADPSADLDGVDAAEKLSILARAAFDADIDPDSIDRRGVRGVTSDECVRAAHGERRIRLVATLRRTSAGVGAQIGPRDVEADGWLGSLRDEWNGAVLRGLDGRVVRVRGRGAGRWPTAQAALADLLEIARHRARERRPEGALS